VSDKAWLVAPRDSDAVRLLASQAGISSVTAQVLRLRGIQHPSDARRFLQPALEHLHDPFAFRAMPQAVRRIHSAIRGGERIAIFGDYDVDGISGLCLLAHFLRLAGAEPLTCIPHRTRDGYGLNIRAVDRLADAGATLLLTVDCGTNNPVEISRARERGVDVVVVDHHEPGSALPDAVAILNPKLPDSGYPFASLCSGGMSFKLAWALSNDLPESVRRSPRYREFLLDAFSFVTLSTFADVVPLVDENRVLVRFGVEALAAVPNPGLRALIRRVGLEGKPLGEFEVAFRIVPMLNALGRMGNAEDAARLFLTRDAAEIETLLDSSERANRERQKTEQAIAAEAVRRVEEGPQRDAAAIVLADEGWHPGVVGIVASRLVDRFHKPAVVLAIDGDRAKGSARSPSGFHLADAIERCRERLPEIRGGGHARAAGVDVPRKRLAEFREAFQELAAAGAAGRAGATLRIDDEIGLGDVDVPLCRELARLAPHGEGNREPLLAARRLAPAGTPRVMKEKHVAFQASDGTRSLRAVAFNMPRLTSLLKKWRAVDIAFSPRLNEAYSRDPELIVRDIREAE
jgi:single-stranded-DNA-specific exonuclease